MQGSFTVRLRTSLGDRPCHLHVPWSFQSPFVPSSRRSAGQHPWTPPWANAGVASLANSAILAPCPTSTGKSKWDFFFFFTSKEQRNQEKGMQCLIVTSGICTTHRKSCKHPKLHGLLTAFLGFCIQPGRLQVAVIYIPLLHISLLSQEVPHVSPATCQPVAVACYSHFG